MRNLASIQTIIDLQPIPGADRIECATILGWEVVCKKGDFKVGDKVCYLEIDSIVPDLPCFEFLRPKKHRIRTCKLRGQISQGIAFPLSILQDVNPGLTPFDLACLKVDQDVTTELKITKYDPDAGQDVLPEQVKKSWIANRIQYLKWRLFGIKPVKRGTFPSFVPKTDETRVQNMSRSLERMEGHSVYFSEKIEGQSFSFISRRTGNWFSKLFGSDYQFLACSRNMTVFDSNEDSDYNHQSAQVAERYGIRAGLKRMNRNLAIQGELIGGRIQCNIYKLPELDFRVFLCYDIDKQQYLPYSEMVEVTRQLGLLTVPILDDAAVIKNDIRYYVELSKGKSKINPSVEREGCVVRSMTENFSFKSINPNYLLNQKD